MADTNDENVAILNYTADMINSAINRSLDLENRPKEIILLAGNWTTDGTYTLIDTSITTVSINIIAPGLNITSNELNTLQIANIQDHGQTNGSLTLKAFGPIPNINIPIRLLVRL